MPFRVALTGGIGSGKSTIASQFSLLGAPIIDSDIISRTIVKRGSKALNEIVHVLGSDIIDENRELNRNKLRELIFNDGIAKSRLEKILHPAIYKEINKQIADTSYPYCIVVIPLLIETEMTNHFDRILLIDTPENIQIQRTTARDNASLRFIRKIIDSQASRDDRLYYADDIIENTVKISELKNTFNKLHLSYLKFGNDKNIVA